MYSHLINLLIDPILYCPLQHVLFSKENPVILFTWPPQKICEKSLTYPKLQGNVTFKSNMEMQQ